MIVFHVQHLAGLVIQSAALRLKILSVTACISLNFEPVARFELMMWSCRCLKVFSVFSECVFIPKLSCRCYGSGGIRLFTRSLTPHTHPPKGTILIYNLLFCISRFVLFFFRFVDFSIIFMCDLEWHFDSGYFISSFECLNTCAYCTWNVSEDVLVYRVMCFAYNTLFACCFFLVLLP